MKVTVIIPERIDDISDFSGIRVFEGHLSKERVAELTAESEYEGQAVARLIRVFM